MKSCIIALHRVILTIAMLLCLASCSITRPRMVDSKFVDFRPYANDDFWISPDPYTGKYEALGQLTISVVPAIPPKGADVNRSSKGPKFEDGVYNVTGSSSSITENIESSELLDIAVRKALDVGANGIADFDISAIFDVSRYGRTLNHYEITGLLIKRLD